MKLKELYDRTSIEIQNILTAVKLNGIEEYTRIERLPSMTGVFDLFSYIKTILDNRTIWFNLIAVIHVNQKDSSHTWNPEKSKDELRDIVSDLVKIMLKSNRYKARNKTIGTGANSRPDGSAGIWDNLENKFVSITQPIIERFDVRLYQMGLYAVWDNLHNSFHDNSDDFKSSINWIKINEICDQLNLYSKLYDLEHQSAFDDCYLRNQLDIGTTFKIGNIHPIKIIFVVDGKAYPENGYTNPSHLYEIVRIQDHIIHCEVCDQNDDTYYAIDRDLVERYL